MRFVLLALFAAPVVLAAACSSGNDEGLTTRECTDGEDNDDNGLVDCDDPGCVDYSVCSGNDTGDGDGGSPKADVTINEFQASNATTIEDESGAFPDWIELHNYGDDDVTMDGWSITDNLDNPGKHDLSGLTISAGEYLVLWADNDTADGPRHLGFVLDMEGEEIGLYDDQGRALTELTYEAQVTDVSAARIPDASGNWEITTTPTPGSSNRPSQ